MPIVFGADADTFTRASYMTETVFMAVDGRVLALMSTAASNLDKDVGMFDVYVLPDARPYVLNPFNTVSQAARLVGNLYEVDLETVNGCGDNMLQYMTKKQSRYGPNISFWRVFVGFSMERSTLPYHIGDETWYYHALDYYRQEPFQVFDQRNEYAWYVILDANEPSNWYGGGTFLVNRIRHLEPTSSATMYRARM